MRFATHDFSLPDLVVSSEQLVEREPGLHVSGIIRHMKTQLDKQRGDFTEDDLGAFATIGRLWEKSLEDALFKEPRYARPGSCERDGIWGSPDCVDL